LFDSINEMIKSIRVEIKSIRVGLINLYRWFPVIWKDRDWDDHYIVEILIKKLEHQRDFFKSNKAYSANANEVASEIQYAIDMLRKTQDSFDHYELPATEALDLKWGVRDISFVPIEGTNLTEMKSNIPNVKNEEDKKQYSKEFRESLQSARNQYMEDKRKVYTFIAENIDKWWD